MNQISEILKTTVFRLFELLVSLVVLSALGTWLSVFSFISSHTAILVALIVLNVLYFAFVSYTSKNLFCDLENKAVYLIINAVCVALLGGVIYTIRSFASNKIFVWMFSLTKLVYFLPFHIPLIVSAAVFMLTLVLVIYFSPRHFEYLLNRTKADEFDSFE